LKNIRLLICGTAAGVINGLFGAGGGMVLVPLLTGVAKLDDDQVFPASVSIILPICLVSLTLSVPKEGIPFDTALPYLLGSIPGGLLAGWLSHKIPIKWLHWVLGAVIIWGGVRYLC
jgi:uncharacterized membrane protein YfcA